MILASLVLVAITLAAFLIIEIGRGLVDTDEGLIDFTPQFVLEDMPLPAEYTDTLKEEPSNEFSSCYYYENTRLDRYLAFAATNPDLEPEDVVWMVDCDLDREPFVDTEEIAEPDSIHALVNKHFNLPSWYVPSDLTGIGNAQIRAEAAEALGSLISAATRDGLSIWASSGFRSYDVQRGTYDAFVAQSAEWEADTYSARAGHSEHQTGLAVDICGYGGYFEVGYAENIWLAAHAHEYGFIVRYTYENEYVTSYIPEAWHLRYIGSAAATTMFDLGIRSYEEYWVKYVLYQPPSSTASKQA